jgi:hypothetical protein
MIRTTGRCEGGNGSAAMTLQFRMFASLSNGDGLYTILYWHDSALVGALPFIYMESIVSEAV